jgi:hypothetical protein
MARYKVAHIKEQGVDLIIVPVDSSYGLESLNQQQELRDELQRHASSAGLAGTVVLVWKKAFGDMEFLARPQLHPFFVSLTYERVLAIVNREIFW